MKKNNELKNVKLTDPQCEMVRFYIIDSLRTAYISQGTLPGDAFEVASNQIADEIIKKVQMGLIQGAVFMKAVKNSEPLKKTVKKVTKKAVKKVIKKHARK